MMMVIAVLPPGGIARSRSLCRQLRARFAQLKILVLCWQYAGDHSETTSNVSASVLRVLIGEL